ncbi:MAG: hypothetical protein HY961_22235 [Ignavibacteriae bacterium]|nr:hypothetical protein [Ignavibacteriota bacterium]
MIATLASAQEREWNILLVNGEEIQNVSLLSVGNDTLYIARSANFTDIVMVDSIARISREGHGAVLPATLIGIGAGGALGLAVHPPSRNQSEANVYSALFGAVVGGAAGFLVGSILQSDEVYDLKNVGRQEKLSIIDSILRGNVPGRRSE